MKQKIFSILLGIFVATITILTLFFGGAFGLIIYESFFKIPEEVTVPSVTAKRVTDSVTFLKKFNLNPKIKEVFQDAIPEGEVVSQDPQAGERVRSGREIKLLSSLGPEMISVPDVRGLTQRKGENELNSKRLYVKSVKINNDTSKNEEITEQNPKAGSRVKRGTGISLVVNKGSVVKYEVPVWEGKTLAEIKENASNTPFTIGRIRWLYDNYTKKDKIIKQTPLPGQFSPEYRPINIDVSAGNMQTELFIKQETILFVIPEGDSRTEVRAVLRDDRGANTIYVADHMPGDSVSLTVTTCGNGELSVVTGGKMIVKARI